MARSTNRRRLRPEHLGGLGRALTSRNYRFYALGHLFHVHGWWGNRVGLGWLTWELTGSAAWLGIIAFAAMAPVMFVGPFAGALADRHGHRRISMTAGAAGSLVTLTIGILAITGHITMPLLLALVAAQGLLFGVDFPSRQSLIPQLVTPGNISAAVALNATTFHLGGFLGPVIAGFLIATLGSGASILMYCATSVWMVAMLSLIRHARPVAHEHAEGGIWSDLSDGFRYVAGNRTLRLLLMLTFTMGMLVRPFHDLLPGFAAAVFARGAEGLATLNAVAGLGALSAALLLLFRGRTKGLTRIMMAAALAAPLGLALFAATTRFPLALVAIAVTAAMLLGSQVGASSLIQNITPPAMRGRVIAINVSLSVGGPALGALLMGWLADQLSLRPVVAASGVLALIVVIAVLPAVRRRTGGMEASPAE